MTLISKNSSEKTLANKLEQLSSVSIENGERYFEAVHTLALQLKLTHFPCPVITVVGTNGKGSAVTFLSTLYHAQGYRVGTYLSPHIFNYNERIQIDLSPISDAKILRAFEQIEAASPDRGTLGYFAMTTLAALLIFQNAHCDVIVLEAGIGGRLDPVNVVDNNAVCLTTIDFDHMEKLGHTLDTIAYEKAGVFRSHQFAVYADTVALKTLQKQAKAKNCDLFVHARDFFLTIETDQWHFQNSHAAFSALPLPLIPPHLAAACLHIAEMLRTQLPFSRPAVEYTCTYGAPTARRQAFPIGNKTFLVDVAHNGQAARYLRTHLSTQYSHIKRWVAIFTLMKDKSLSEVIAPFEDCIAHWYIVCLPGDTRCQDVTTITTYLNSRAQLCTACETMTDAHQLAIQHPAEGILVFGSCRLAAPVIFLLQPDAQTGILQSDKSNFSGETI